MAKQRDLKTAVISALIGCVLGGLAYLLFFYGLSQPGAAISETQPTTTATPAPTPIQ